MQFICNSELCHIPLITNSIIIQIVTHFLNCLYKHSQGTVECFSRFFCHSSSAQASVSNSAGLLYILQCTFCDIAETVTVQLFVRAC
jgi:hypothetical protein